MRGLLLLVVASVTLLVASARAADITHANGYEVGAWRWTRSPASPLEARAQKALVLSVGRWRRFSTSVTRMTRLEYGDLVDFDFPPSTIPESNTWTDVGHSVTVETGFFVHPPLNVGIAPYVGANLGAGVALLGDRHRSESSGSYWVVATKSRGPVPVIVVSAEIGLCVLSRRGWPGCRAALGLRLMGGPFGGGSTTEPVLSISY